MPLIGLDSLYVAQVTKDDATGTTYGTPQRIAGAINMKVTPSVDSQNVFADDAVQEIIQVFSQVDVEFEIAEMSNAIYKLLLGKTVNSAGVTYDNAGDIAPFFAIGFRAKKSDGSYRYVWLYKGKFEISDEEFSTGSDKADFKTASVKGTFIKRVSDGKWRGRVDSNDPSVTGATTSAWFTTVYQAN